jgi:hypothetical protein
MPADLPSPTQVPCPSNALLDRYIGLDRQEVYRRLGKPDWVDPWTSQHWYKLTSPLSGSLRGGGYCSFGFLFDDHGMVARVSVSVAK